MHGFLSSHAGLCKPFCHILSHTRMRRFPVSLSLCVVSRSVGCPLFFGQGGRTSACSSRARDTARASARVRVRSPVAVRRVMAPLRLAKAFMSATLSMLSACTGGGRLGPAASLLPLDSIIARSVDIAQKVSRISVSGTDFVFVKQLNVNTYRASALDQWRCRGTTPKWYARGFAHTDIDIQHEDCPQAGPEPRLASEQDEFVRPTSTSRHVHLLRLIKRQPCMRSGRSLA